METFSVLLSDGENEWWATMKAKSYDHLYDLIDADGYDVVETRLENQYMKKLYRVELNEIHCATFEVEATSEQNAVNEVLDGSGDLVHSEYSYTPDNDAVRHVSCKED